MKRRVFLVLGILIFVLCARSAYALFRETDINYYYDDAFFTWVGEETIDCDGTYTLYGIIASFRVFDQYRCSDGARVVHRCQQTDGMGGWITVTCPPNQP